MAAIRGSQDMLQTRMHSLLRHTDNSRGFRRDSVETQRVSITTIARERIPEPNTQLIKPLRCRVRPELTTTVIQSITGCIKKKKKKKRVQQKPCVQQVANLGLPQVNYDCGSRQRWLLLRS